MSQTATLFFFTAVLAWVVYYAWWCLIRRKLLERRLTSFYDEFDATVVRLGMQDHPCSLMIKCRQAACTRAALDITLPTLVDFQELIGQHYVPKSAVSGNAALDSAIDLLRLQKAEAVAFHAEWYRVSGYLWKVWDRYCAWRERRPETNTDSRDRKLPVSKSDTVRLVGETIDALCDSEMLEAHAEPAEFTTSFVRIPDDHDNELADSQASLSGRV